MGNILRKKYAPTKPHNHTPDIVDFRSPHSDVPLAITSLSTTESLSGGDDRQIALVDWSARTCRRNWAGHTGCVNSIALDESKDTFFTGSRDCSIRQWRLNDTQKLQTFNDHTLSVSSVAVGNGYLASGGRDTSVRLWDIATGQCLHTNSIPRNIVTCLKFFSNEPVLLQCSEDLRVRLWDTRDDLRLQQVVIN